MASRSEVRGVVRDLEDALVDGVVRTRAFLASPAGSRLRSLVATGLVLATPLMLRHPFFRTPLGRLVQIGGGAALVAKAAEALRDWEPGPVATTRAASATPRIVRVTKL